MTTKPHFTTRRAFVAAAGFGGVSLYGLWAAYGAAPNPFATLTSDETNNTPDGPNHEGAAVEPPPQAAQGGAHSAHGGTSPTGPNAQEFSQMTAEFSERYRLPDGRVYPRRLAAVTANSDDPHAGHDMAKMDMPAPADPHAAHTDPVQAPKIDAAVSNNHGPIDVLMTAGKWFYLPNALRLDAGQAYRFRMMALDVSHGASIQFGKGGRMMRLQPGRITETVLTFERPGRYLMHCTVYCGEAHDMMQATIEVV